MDSMEDECRCVTSVTSGCEEVELEMTADEDGAKRLLMLFALLVALFLVLGGDDDIKVHLVDEMCDSSLCVVGTETGFDGAWSIDKDGGMSSDEVDGWYSDHCMVRCDFVTRWVARVAHCGDSLGTLVV